MKAPVLALAVGAALAGGCGKGSIADHDSGPPPSVVTFELRNDGIATVYLLQDCLVEYTITSLGHSLREPFEALCAWALDHEQALAAAAVAYDRSRE